MSVTLNHYVHCPFCVRVRMTFGHLGLAYTSKVLPYDDEATPLRLTGTKMLPILETSQGAINESLDIMALADRENRLGIKVFMITPEYKEIEKLLAQIGSLVHSIAMPYWMWTPEFTPSSREYFQKNKEKKRGPFKELVKNQSSFIKEINPLFTVIEEKLIPFYDDNKFSVKDILIASHVWGLYVVPEFQFSPKMHEYLQRVKAQCHFNYHEDFWK